ncbi:hypothetical protein HPB51_004639 [Rhipicephalus microplus]|uniref:Uncharacterized protein n=1 Tax=Rhipicephalus microplus TaxID=6941 RepID=A0A9J6DYL6_RHIMP|nr:hypothetical protein HPB51_004639 [Rhipicephalus microplus]
MVVTYPFITEAIAMYTPKDDVSARRNAQLKHEQFNVVVTRQHNVCHQKMPCYNHYRICEFGGFDCIKQPSIVDRSALRFNTSLLERVNSVCAQAFPDVGRCPKAPGLGSPW